MPNNVSILIKLQNDDINSHCPHGALTDSYGMMVQFVLGILAFASLILKRYFEPLFERRPWLIWFFDTSKQAIGALVIHFANIFLSDIFHGDPCTWYITNFLMDSTVGLVIIFALLKFFQYTVKLKGYKSLKFGSYGKPPSLLYWLRQCGIYIAIMIIEKIFITILIQFKFFKNIFGYLTIPINNPKIEVALVVLIIPLFINILMFWIIDNMLMNKHIHIRKHGEEDMKFYTNIRYKNVDKKIDSDCNTNLIEE
ncbi:unnamed protein product [Gordionus sp. m RMFG-2023]|uniref:store-operated calcium entry regulator STIMATE-like n=1 Tax=Gordionus sp. m RMFG-2023 TaxID=3053472 RepID=UPI0030E083DA